jgi:hypothetical protein
VSDENEPVAPGSNADYKEALAHTLTWLDEELTEILRIAAAIRAGAGLDDKKPDES